jgi:hypothetical protein
VCWRWPLLTPVEGDAGGLLGNLPYVRVGADVSESLSAAVRSTALTFILTRAGLGVDLAALRQVRIDSLTKLGSF